MMGEEGRGGERGRRGLGGGGRGAVSVNAAPAVSTPYVHGQGGSKALSCPLSNAVRPFLSLPASSSSTLNSTLEDGLIYATGSCNITIPLQLS